MTNSLHDENLYFLHYFQIPLHEIYSPPSSSSHSGDLAPQQRNRSTTIGNGHAARLGKAAAAAESARAAAKERRAAKNNKKLIPTVFR